MQVDILTLFPEMFQGPLNESLLKKAQTKGLLSFKIINLRDYATDKHHTADDTPYGGGAGMVMKADLIKTALAESAGYKIYMCPTGKQLTQKRVKELAQKEKIVILCGHYEGVDERVRALVDEELSLGDYVLTGGELPALVLIDAVARYVPGVVKEEDSVSNDSFAAGLLDYPCYTRPEDLGGAVVPEVLLSGNHATIDRWRKKEALKKTFYQRPDLLAKMTIDDDLKKLLSEILTEE